MKVLCRGWTLIELLVVLVIMGVMVGTVVWRLSAWTSSRERQQLHSLSGTWKQIVSTAVTRGMNVSCRVSKDSWHCWSWVASLSGQADWTVMSSYPWQGKTAWLSRWKWRGSSRINIWSDGRHEPEEMTLCHAHSNHCWAVFSEKRVSR